MSAEPDLAAAAAEVRQGIVRLSGRMRAGRSPHGLSVAKLSVLGHLRRQGRSTPATLAAAERQRPQSLTRVLADLERDGLLARTPDPADRRRTVLELTPIGAEALARDMADRDAWLIAALAGLTDTERAVLVLAGTLMNRLADPVPRS